MYTPSAFVVDDLPTLHGWIERYSFATLFSAASDALEASHLPLLLDREEGAMGTLVGHFARANEQHRRGSGERVLAIFHGPHAYVSPRWYESANLVPTWNYIAVHAYGRLEIVDDPAATLELVRRMTAHYEASFDEPWQLAAPEDALLSLAKQIVAFRIRIERLEGKAKLSQNHPRHRRESVIAGLGQSAVEQDRDVAAAMRATLAAGSGP